MTIRTVLTYPDPFLRQVAEPVTGFGPCLDELIRDMSETMWDEPGIGLAAPQIGVGLRLFVYDLEVSRDYKKVAVACNPEFVLMEGEESDSEGCLSVPDFTADVKRAARVIMKAQDRDGELFELDVSGLHARVLQHENDHLNGVLFIDHISALKRGIYKRRIKKALAGNSGSIA
ncbi:MAG: peptide deformylase [Leptospirillia bacterium]